MSRHALHAFVGAALRRLLGLSSGASFDPSASLAAQSDFSDPAAFRATSASGAAQVSPARKGWVPSSTLVPSAVCAAHSSFPCPLSSGGGPR